MVNMFFLWHIQGGAVHEAENTALAPGEDDVMIMVLLGKTAEPPHCLALPTLRRPKT
jgi:hypothetical protein